MKPQIVGLRVAGTVFGLMALAQLARLLWKATIVVGSHELPFWPSALAAIVLAGLSLWLWNLSNHPT